MPKLGWTKDKDGRGWLCVVDETTSYSAPERVCSWWPVYECTEYDARGLVGSDCRPCNWQGGGVYEACVGPGFAVWKPFILKDGGKTLPVRTDVEPVPPPKVRKGVETRWRFGRWEKYLKSRGWVWA